MIKSIVSGGMNFWKGTEKLTNNDKLFQGIDKSYCAPTTVKVLFTNYQKKYMQKKLKRGFISHLRALI